MKIKKTHSSTNKRLIDFKNGLANPTHKEGRLFYDDTNKCLAFYNDETDVTLQIGQEVWIRGLNNTGSTILNGQVICITGQSGGIETIGLAKADERATSICTIAIATHDIEDGTIGIGTVIGTVRDIDTSSFAEGDILYLSADTAGAIVNTEPASPNFSVVIGTCGISDASTGRIQAHIDINDNTHSSFKFYNGSILEQHTVDVTSNGTTVTLTLDDTGDNLSVFFDGEFVKFPVPATVDLTAGSDASPTRNYIYIPNSTRTLTANTTGFPTNQQIVRVADVLVQSAASAQTNGIRKVYAWTDHLANSAGQGHLTDLNYWIRQQHASYQSGVALTTTPAEGAGSSANLYLSTTAGVVLQLHPHTFPAFNTATGSDIHVYNDPVTPNKLITAINLTSIPTGSAGNSLTNKYGVFNLWGSVSEDTGDCHLFLNLPNGVYTVEADALDDVNNTADTTIPLEFRGTGFLIAQLVIKFAVGGVEIPTGGIIDKRGVLPGTSAGSGTGVSITVFPDNQFEIFNNTDPTKRIDVDASAITTGNTRTITMADADVDLAGVLSPTNKTDLTDSGDSTLHYHATDRDRANHTGTQVASTISDFDTEVANNSAVSANTSKVSADGSIDTHSDVDITTDAVAKNDILRWNGTKFVPSSEGETFTYSCTAFDDGLTTGILAGSGVWKASSAINYTATYLNGPPTTSNIQKSINGAAYSTIGTMTGPAYTTGVNTDAVNYPTVDQYIRFRLESTDGVEATEYDYAASLYFYNYIYYGPSTTGSGFSEANVEALTGTISPSYTASRSINSGASEYVVWAYPSRYTSIHATGALFNGITMPFTAPETVSITNSAGLTENYKVFASTGTNLGNHTLQLSTSSNVTNLIYYGGSTLNTGWSEAQIKALTDVNTTASNDTTQTFNSVTLGASEYFVFAYPSRLADPSNWFDNGTGFPLSLNAGSPETVSITNANGYTENYDVWVSNNILGPGAFQLRTT